MIAVPTINLECLMKNVTDTGFIL